MTSRFPAGFTLLLTVSSACVGGQETPMPGGAPSGFQNAYAAPSCAPWDGYAVSLVLRNDALAPTDSLIENGQQPHLQIGLYPRNTRGENPSGLEPITFAWPAEPVIASAGYCVNGRCEDTPQGRVRVASVSPSGDFAGDVEITLKDGKVVRGSYQAKWRDRTILCG